MAYERLNLKTGQVITEEVFAHLEDGIEGAANAVLMTPILYADLVALRDAGKLKAGMFYRITDYVTTTIQENTQSAGHAFDVIVMATDSQTLSEEARAIVHEGDTYFTEAGANLAAWKVWYALDNDSTRFAWADAENGKGVIYRLIDEWNNDCPYDFKNIILDIPMKVAGEMYQYGNWYPASMVRVPSEDMSVEGAALFAWEANMTSGPSGSATVYSKDEELNDTTLYDVADGAVTESIVVKVTKVIAAIHQYTFKAFSDDGEKDDSLSPYMCVYNVMKAYSIGGRLLLNMNSLGRSCSYNSFGDNCNSNIFGGNCSYNSFGGSCNYNSFGGSCNSNIFGNSCQSNSFGNNCYSNSFGDSCSYNSFGDYCYYNKFLNTEGEVAAFVRHNSFGNGLTSVVLQNDETASYGQQIQNYRIANGMTGTTVEVTRGLAYETTIAKATDGTIKQFNMADLAN